MGCSNQFWKKVHTVQLIHMCFKTLLICILPSFSFFSVQSIYFKRLGHLSYRDSHNLDFADCISVIQADFVVLFVLDSVFYFRYLPQMSDASSLSAGEEWGRTRLTWAWHTWVGLTGNSFSWDALPLLGNRQCQFLHDSCLQLCRSLREELLIPAWRVWAWPPSFWEPSGKRGWGSIPAHICSPSPQLPLEYPSSPQIVPSASPRDLHFILSRECIFRLLPG